MHHGRLKWPRSRLHFILQNRVRTCLQGSRLVSGLPSAPPALQCSPVSSTGQSHAMQCRQLVLLGPVAKFDTPALFAPSHRENRGPVNYVTKAGQQKYKNAHEGNPKPKSQCQQQGTPGKVCCHSGLPSAGRALGPHAAATQVKVPMQPYGWCECKNDMQKEGQGKPKNAEYQFTSTGAHAGHRATCAASWFDGQHDAQAGTSHGGLARHSPTRDGQALLRLW